LETEEYYDEEYDYEDGLQKDEMKESKENYPSPAKKHKISPKLT